METVRKQFWLVDGGKVTPAQQDTCFDGVNNVLVFARTSAEAAVIAAAYGDDLVGIDNITTDNGETVAAVYCSDEQMAWWSEYSYRATWLIETANADGYVQIGAGVYLNSSAFLMEEQKAWPEEDYASEFDFSSHSYWITTDDGQEPIAICGASDQDLIRFVEVNASEYLTDEQMMVLAAKAAGIGLMDNGEPDLTAWNPLEDDCDALRLAVKLEIDITQHKDGDDLRRPSYACANYSFSEEYKANGNSYAATRRAIVRAAAEIAKTL